MVRIATQDELAEVREALERSGADWNEFLGTWDEVILVGSHAQQCHHEDSDIDLVCIGEPSRYRVQGVDIIQVTPHSPAWQNWLGSELAQHTAAFGAWIKGDGNWLEEARSDGHLAIEQKTRRLKSRLFFLIEHWSQLGSGYQQKWIRLISRDLYRLHCLLKAQAVPSAPVIDQLLDTEWDWRLQSEGLLTELKDPELFELLRRFQRSCC